MKSISTVEFQAEIGSRVISVTATIEHWPATREEPAMTDVTALSWTPHIALSFAQQEHLERSATRRWQGANQ